VKLTEMRQMTAEELRAKIESLRKELFEARFKKAVQQLEDTAIFRRLRTQIAQMETVLREQERQGDTVNA